MAFPGGTIPGFAKAQTQPTAQAKQTPAQRNIPGTADPAGLSSGQQSAYDLMDETLKSWGLGDLANTLRQLIVKGDTNPDTLSLELSQTSEYKQRFAGNAIRKANGLAELNPAQYLAMEEGYRQVLQSYGMPKGFYDSNSDFTKFIGNDISASELQSRVQVAHDQYTAAPDYVKSLWNQYFGTKGDAIAAILDPNTATSLIQDRGQQVALGGAAKQYGFNINQQRAQQFQQEGLTLDQARNAYQKIAQNYGSDQTIAKRFGTTIDQATEENAFVLGQQPALQKRQVLGDEEQALFQGGVGASQTSVGVSQSY